MKGKRNASIHQDNHIKTWNKPNHRKDSKGGEETTKTSSAGKSADFESNDGQVSHNNGGDKNDRPSLEPAPDGSANYNNHLLTSDVKQDLSKSSTRRMCDGSKSRPSTHLVDGRSETIKNGLLNKGLSYTVIPANQRSHLKRPKIPSKSPERKHLDGCTNDEGKSVGIKPVISNRLPENAQTASDRKKSTDILHRNKRESRSSETHLHPQSKRIANERKVTDLKLNSNMDRTRRRDSELSAVTTFATHNISQHNAGTGTRIPGPNPSIVGAARRVAGRFIASRTTPRIRMKWSGYRRECYVDVPWTYTSNTANTASLQTTYQRTKPKHASKLPLSVRMVQNKEEYRLQPTRQHHVKAKNTTKTSCTPDESKEEFNFWSDSQPYKSAPETNCNLTTECSISPGLWPPGNVRVENVTMTPRRPSVIPRYKSDISHTPGIRYVARTENDRRKSATARKGANNKNAENRNHEGDVFTSLNPHKALPSIPHTDSRDVGHKQLPCVTMTNTARASTSIASDSSSFNKQFTKSIRAKAATRRVSGDKATASTTARASHSSNRQFAGKSGLNLGPGEFKEMSLPIASKTVDGWLDSQNSFL